jgi:hypothetical protein
VGDFDKKGTSKPSAFNGLEIPRVYILFKEEGIMKKQWLSIVLVLCMVLCMAPATALAAEGKTGTLKITVDISGVYEGDNVGDKTFSFEILRKYANYGHYKYVDITIKSGETEHTEYVPVEEGKYVVKQTGHATIDKYDWENASHQPGNTVESNEQEVFAGKTKSVTVHNFYKIAVTKEITELPIEIDGYALNAKAGDIEASTDQMRVDIHKVTIKQRNASGGWDDLASDATIQANTQYAVEIFVNAKPEYTCTGLTKDKVTVNGKEASVFENPSTQSGGDMRVFYELEVLEVVKTVESIEITTPPAKTEYMVGEDFDPTGMVVTAHYTDDTTADLSRDKYVIFYGDKLALGRASVTIQYNDGSGGSNIKTYQAITVKPYVGPHTHTYGGPWYADAKSHWHQCTDSACPDPSGSTKDLASHTFVWKVDQAATTTQTGLKHEECTVCSYKRSENTEIPALRDYAVTVTCGTATVAAGTPITHAMEGVEVTVTAQAPAGTHFVKWVVKAGGITLANETSATTTFTMPGNDVNIEATYKDAPPSHTHSYGTEWKYDGTNHWHECECGDKADIAAHSASEWIIDTAATETADGAKHKECTVCKKVLETATIPATHTHSYGTDWKYDDTNHWHECECGDKADVAAHSASEWIVDTAATETAEGAKHKECTVCKKVLETATIPATGSSHTHSYGTDWKYDDTNHWHECECGDKADTAAHSFQWVIDKAATKEATGIKHEECTVCGAKRSENTVIDKLPDSGNTGNTGSGDNNTDKPGKDDSTKSPQTGDSSNLIGWLAALFVSGGVLTVLGVSSKKRKESEAE